MELYFWVMVGEPQLNSFLYGFDCLFTYRAFRSIYVSKRGDLKIPSPVLRKMNPHTIG